MWNILDPKTFNKNCFFILLRNPWTPKITIDFVIFTLSSHKLDEPKDSAIDSQLFFSILCDKQVKNLRRNVMSIFNDKGDKALANSRR